MLLFKHRFLTGIAAGEITLTLRHWKNERVKAGREYRCPPLGRIAVETLDLVAFGDVPAEDARRSGFESVPQLRDYLARRGDLPQGDATQLYRVAFRFLGPEEPSELPGEVAGPEDVEALAQRLAKMDRLSRSGPWTEVTLSLIAAHPRVAAAKLAPRAGRETLEFKANVRKLKRLGLTVSHEVGYSLSPRGRAFLATRGSPTEAES